MLFELLFEHISDNKPT